MTCPPSHTGLFSLKKEMKGEGREGRGGEGEGVGKRMEGLEKGYILQPWLPPPMTHARTTLCVCLPLSLPQLFALKEYLSGYRQTCLSPELVTTAMLLQQAE